MRRTWQSIAIGSALLWLCGCEGEGEAKPASVAQADQGGGQGGAAGAAGGLLESGAGGLAESGAGGNGGGAESGAGGAAAAGSVAGSGANSAGGTGAGGAGGMVAAADTVPTLYWLDITDGRVLRSSDFASSETMVARIPMAPDGVAVDVAGDKIYWTNMGSALGTGGGSVQRTGLHGGDVETIVEPGIAQTPKQMTLDLVNHHIYFCDREGAKVWRAGLGGEDPEAIVSGHGFQQLVGIALDVPGGKFYFTDRNGKKILRASIEMPAGQSGADRTDIEELIVFTGDAMPIDLDIDHVHQQLYWTDRVRGTLSRANLEIPAGQSAAERSDLETLVDDLVDPIGISLDVDHDKLYFTELGGVVSEAALDGSALSKGILRSTSATGIALAYIPKP